MRVWIRVRMDLRVRVEGGFMVGIRVRDEWGLQGGLG